MQGLVRIEELESEVVEEPKETVQISSLQELKENVKKEVENEDNQMDLFNKGDSDT